MTTVQKAKWVSKKGTGIEDKNKPCKCGHKTTKCDCADVGIFTCSCKCDCKKKENKSHIRWGTSSFIRMVESEK